MRMLHNIDRIKNNSFPLTVTDQENAPLVQVSQTIYKHKSYEKIDSLKNRLIPLTP